VPIAGRVYRDLRTAFERGDYDEVLSSGRQRVATLDADPGQRDYAPAALLIVGAALTERERYVEAVPWLEQGLSRLAGTASDRELSGGHWHHRLLADLYLLTGRWDDARRYLDWLARPGQPLDSRLAATRGLAGLAAARGRFDDAHLLLNTATDLASRTQSTQLAAMVTADRALVISAQGRLHEAVRFADDVAPSLSARSRGPAQQWANAQAAALLTTLARRLAEGGDPMTAQRYLIEVAEPVAAAGRSYWDAHLDLARGVVSREGGEPFEAEAVTLRALSEFNRLGTAPAAAQARLDEAKLADALGYRLSALELYRRAVVELGALGLPRETADAQRHLATLGG
jgi:tetratricopeptide (TPR) repeat protein